MPDITLRGLTPDRTYHLSARATAGEEHSEWTPLVAFRSGKDSTAPRAPGNFKVTVSGNTFQASWTKPTDNEDGTVLRDLRGYIITAQKPGDTTKTLTKTAYLDTGVVINYWDVVETFGTFQGILDFKAYSFDASGNVSTTPALFTATKNAPPPITGLTWVSQGDSFVAKWTPPTHPDILDYEITVTNGTTSAVFYSTQPTWTFSRAMNQGAFISTKTSVTISVKVRDTAFLLSTAVTATATKAVPAAVTGLALAVVADSFRLTWNEVTTDSTGASLTDRSGYQIRMVAGALERFAFSQTPSYTLTLADNKALFGSAKGSIVFYVGARDTVNQIGTEASVTGTMAKPATPVLSGTPRGDEFLLTWAAIADATHYELWVNGSLMTTIAGTATSYVYSSTNYGVSHSAYIKAVNSFGIASDNSNTVSYTPTSPFTVDTAAPGLPTAITTATPTTTERPPATYPPAVRLSWTKPSDPDLDGYNIRYSESALSPRVWQYRDVMDKAATSATIEVQRSSTAYVFQIRPFDDSFNAPDWPATEYTGTSSLSHMPVTEISTTATIVTGGTLRSNDYVASSNDVPGTGWLISPSLLTIEKGKINAAVISAGELRSRNNITAGLPDAGQPVWSLNIGGNATFRDLKVRGKVTVGESDLSSASVAVQSWNYGVTGQTGPQWALRGDGTFDIKSSTGNRIQLSSSGLEAWVGSTRTLWLDSAGGNATFDGTLYARGGSITGNLSITGELQVYGAGNAMVKVSKSGTGNWIALDGRSTTDYAIASTNNNFYVTYDGTLYASSATIGGSITATGGSVGGWTIGTDSIYKGSVSLTASTGVISGAKITAGTIQGNTIKSTNEPTTANSWRLDNDGIAFWNGANPAVRTAYIRYDGYAELNNVVINGSGTFGGTVNASGGTFSGTVTGGTFEGGTFKTSSNASTRIEMGPNLNLYGGTGNSLLFGNRLSMNIDTNGDWKMSTYDATRLGQFHSYANGAFRFSTADANTNNALESMLFIDGRGVFIDKALSMNSKRLYLRGYGDNNHYLEVGGDDGPKLHGYTNVSLYTNWGRVFYVNDAGEARGNKVYSGGNLVTTSLRASKTSIKPAGKKKDKIKQLKAVSFVPKDDDRSGQRLSFIAEEVEEIIPEAAGYSFEGGEKKLVGIDHMPMIALAIQGLQEAMEEIDELRAEVASLRQQLPPKK